MKIQETYFSTESLRELKLKCHFKNKGLLIVFSESKCPHFHFFFFLIFSVSNFNVIPRIDQKLFVT